MTRCLLAATLLAALVSMTTVSAGSAQGPECFGEPATITGSDPLPNFDSCNGNNGSDVAQHCEATTNVP